MNIESIKNGVMITLEEKEDYTLENLKQKIINDLYSTNNYEESKNENELLQIVLEYSR